MSVDSLDVVTAVACLSIGAVGYLVGRMHERAYQSGRRGGMLPVPIVPAVEDFPAWRGSFERAPAVSLFDQEKRDKGDGLLLASIGHPLVADPAGHTPDDPGVRLMAANMDAIHSALDRRAG